MRALFSGQPQPIQEKVYNAVLQLRDSPNVWPYIHLIGNGLQCGIGETLILQIYRLISVDITLIFPREIDGRSKAQEDVDAEHCDAHVVGGDDGLGGLFDDVVVAGGCEGLQIAAPAPVGCDEGLADAVKPFRQGKGCAREGHLEAD